MKKLLSVVLALAVMLSCAALSAAAEGMDYTGEWYLNRVIFGEVTVSPSVAGMSASMVINADGTAVIEQTQNGESDTDNATWTAGETGLTVTDSSGFPMEFVLQDGILVWDLGIYKMGFSREQPEPSAPFPEVTPAGSLDAFQGTWKMAYADVNGTLVPAEVFPQLGQNVDALLVVEGSQAAYTLTMTQEIPVITGTLTLTDGTASYSVAGHEVMEDVVIDVTINLQMTDSGLIRSEFIVTTSEGEPTVIYLEKAAEEDAAPAA